MKICNVCGSNLEDSVNICPICGNNMISTPGQQPHQPNVMQYNGQPNQSQQSYGSQGGPQYGTQGGPQYGTQGGPQYGTQGGQPYGQPQQLPKKKGMPGWAIALIVFVVAIPVLAIFAAAFIPALLRYNKKAKEAKEGTTTAFEITTEDFTSEITEADVLIEDIDDAFSSITEEATEEDIEEATEDSTEETTEAEVADTYLMPEMNGTVFRSNTFNYELDFSEGNWVFSDVDERASMVGQDVSKINSDAAVQESMKEDGFFYYTLIAFNNEETVGICAYDGFTRSTPAKVDDEGFIKQLEDELMSSGDMTFTSMDTKIMTIDGEEHIVLYGTALQNGSELKIEMYYYVNGDYCSFIYAIGDDFDKMEYYIETL